MSKKMIIDFKDIEGPVYTGRARGEQLRQKYDLDIVDRDENTHVEVSIPGTTYSISSSFFLGLFGPSVVRFGSKEAFYDKYHFSVSEFLRGIIDSCASRALQDRNIFPS